jgi:amidase
MISYRAVVALTLVVILSGSSKHEAPKAYAVEEVPLAQISADLASGRTTAVAVTQAYIRRIKQYDHALHAVILVAPDALDEAAASDRRRAEHRTLGPLDGVPILLKDNIDVAGVPTTAGSYALRDNIPARDSEVARRLRAAGAVILGKANTSQFAGLRTTDIFEGSTVGGVPHNPYRLSHAACGSSNGSAIAVAASFAAAAVGTDTTGSVICPSSQNGDVGLRPTLALISRRGIVPVDLAEDTAGPIARTVTDTALLLTAIAGSDPSDPLSKDADAHKGDYAQGLSADALKGVRLGVLRHFFGYSDATQAVFDRALQVLRAQGAELVEIPSSLFEDLSQEQRLIMLYDFKDDVAAYLSGAPPAVKTRTLADLIEFDKSDPHEKKHAQDLFEDSEKTTGGRENPDYVKTLQYAQHKAGAEEYGRALKDYNVQALVVLATGPAKAIQPDGTKTDYVAAVRPKGAVPPSPSGTAALAGYPDLSVPMGMVEGMPVGLSFIGAPWSEHLLLSLGYAYEQASHARVAPTAYKRAMTTQRAKIAEPEMG